MTNLLSLFSRKHHDLLIDLEDSLKLFKDGHVSEAINSFHAIQKHLKSWHYYDVPVDIYYTNRQSLMNRQSIMKFFCFYEHSYLKNISVENKIIYSLSFARFAGIQLYDTNDGLEWDILAIIMGTDYFFDLEIPQIVKAIYEEDHPQYDIYVNGCRHSIDHKNYKALFPEISILPSLSYTARCAFIYSIKYWSRLTNLVSYDRILNWKSVSQIPGIDELIDAELINTHIDPHNLLISLSLNELNNIAREKRVKIFRTKRPQVQEIVEKFSDDDLLNVFEVFNLNHFYYYLMVSNLPQLVAFLRTEINRITLVKDWLTQINFPKIAPRLNPIREFTPEEKELGEQQYREQPSDYHIDSNKIDDFKRMLTKEEQDLILTVWDSKCDEIVRECAEYCLWYMHDYFYTTPITERVVEYLGENVIWELHKKAKNLSTHWKSIINIYGSIRFFQMGLKIREPHWILCNNCGHKFIEWSVWAKFAMNVGYKILFCNSCYQKIFYFSEINRSLNLSDEEMLVKIASFCQITENIPTAEFMRFPDLSKLSESTQIEAAKLLLTMPTYQQYVQAFGSWMMTLRLSGVLGDEPIKTVRGYKCLAEDGHVCYSLAEKVIDDWLTRNNINHEKEPFYPIDNQINPYGRLRADWKIGNIYIEYAGLLDDTEYFDKMKSKEALSSQAKISLIIIKPDDLLSLNEKLLHNLNISRSQNIYLKR